MRSFLSQTAHRPYPMPDRPRVMYQTWYNLLFAHWPVSAAALRALIPQAVELDLYEGQAWLGVVPFGMRGVYPRGTFPVPGLSAFPELNVRTYVTMKGKPGVWFFSLDAANSVAVALARSWFHLPYFNAAMTMQLTSGDWISYRSRRTHRDAPPAEFVGRFRPVGDVFLSRPGSLEHWLTERYCLYCTGARGEVYRGEVHHAPWPLQSAEAEIEVNSMAPAGLTLPDVSPLLHFARSIETTEWALEPVR